MADRRLQLETEAAQRLKETLIAEYGEDAELLRDMLEGETNLQECIKWATLELASVEGIKAGIEIAIAKLKERLTRHCNRAQALRDGIQVAMETAELTSLKTPAATLSMRPSPPRCEITDAAQLPAIYVNQPAPVPDKRAILAALKKGEAVPGATLSNQPASLTVRLT